MNEFCSDITQHALPEEELTLLDSSQVESADAATWSLLLGYGQTF